VAARSLQVFAARRRGGPGTALPASPMARENPDLHIVL
jgi:hypothetical protein